MRGIYGNFSRDFTLEEQGPGAQVRQQCPAEARQRPGLSVAKWPGRHCHQSACHSGVSIARTPIATRTHTCLPEHCHHKYLMSDH